MPDVQVLRIGGTDGYIEQTASATGEASVAQSPKQLLDYFVAMYLNLYPGQSAFIMVNTRAAIPVGPPVTMWNSPGEFIHNTTATQISVISDSPEDNPAGTGTGTMGINGLDADRNPIGEVLQLNGQTPVLTTQTFLRQNEAGSIFSGSNFFNVGTITFTINGNIVATMLPQTGLVIQGVWSLAAGHSMILTSFSMQAAKNETLHLLLDTYFSLDGGMTFTAQRIGPVIDVFQTTTSSGYPVFGNPTFPFLDLVVRGENAGVGGPPGTSVVTGIIIDDSVFV